MRPWQIKACTDHAAFVLKRFLQAKQACCPDTWSSRSSFHRPSSSSTPRILRCHVCQSMFFLACSSACFCALRTNLTHSLPWVNRWLHGVQSTQGSLEGKWSGIWDCIHLKSPSSKLSQAGHIWTKAQTKSSALCTRWQVEISQPCHPKQCKRVRHLHPNESSPQIASRKLQQQMCLLHG